MIFNEEPGDGLCTYIGQRDIIGADCRIRLDNTIADIVAAVLVILGVEIIQLVDADDVVDLIFKCEINGLATLIGGSGPGCECGKSGDNETDYTHGILPELYGVIAGSGVNCFGLN